MTTLAVDEAWDRLATAAQLLNRAALTVWERADAEPIDSPLHGLGLGIYLAGAHTTALLPPDHEAGALDDPAIARLEAKADPGTAQGVLGMLLAAEELTSSLPIHRPELAPATQTGLELCDLIREARALGY